MEIQRFLEDAVKLDDIEDRRHILAQRLSGMEAARQDEFAQSLKDHADRLMRTDTQQCLRVTRLLEDLAEISGNPLHRALGLLARANALSIVLGEYRQAAELYAQATAIYAEQGCLVEQAQAQIGNVFTLGVLGRLAEAQASYQWASEVLQSHVAWFQLARLHINMAIVNSRLGEDSQALALFDQAREAYRQMGIEGEPHWLRVEFNRAVVLRNLGRFDEAIQSSRMAMEKYHQLGQEVAAARAEWELAITYFVLGRYNESLAMLDHVRQVLLQDGRQLHAILVEHFISDCLLQLRRFPEVLEKSQQVRQLFGARGTHYEVGQAILNEASAYIGLGQYKEALLSLAEARHLFELEGNPVAMADADLKTAQVAILEGRAETGPHLAQRCTEIYTKHDLPVWQARALLIAGRAALALEQWQPAQAYARLALALAEARSLPDIAFPARHLAGQLAVQAGDLPAGLAAFEQAIQEIESLCGHMMVEFRASFVEDKERIYEDAVDLSLRLDRPLHALELAERAKSRALLDLLAHRLDLSISARSPADQPIVEELHELRAQRDHLYRRMHADKGVQRPPVHPSVEGYGQRGENESFAKESDNQGQRILALEKKITELWHRLLIRNADYAREATLWQVRSEPIQPYLEPGTLLLEYYCIRGQFIAFLVTRQSVSSRRLEISIAQVQQLLQLLWLNLHSVPHGPAGRLELLHKNALGILAKLYQGLLAPFESEIQAAERLVIVPHNALHYIPFQALYDGGAYLCERQEISYLPGANVLRYCQPAIPPADGAVSASPCNLLAVGHSYQGRLPFTLQEAEVIAGMWNGQTLLEEQATLGELRQRALDCRVLHLAAHGDFRPDNPLFSGLALADGWLTTLDIFNLRLSSALVTLSACQSGRSVVGGGDELLGLMRSFLAAGASALVSTLWAVEDRSTAQLMASFYTYLSQGQRKGAALRQAQLDLMHDPQESAYRHPYFWAPFFLVGNAGPL
jgi:CHAT domain-containing protein/tetratricopeptide (TPR) repeat protein